MRISDWSSDVCSSDLPLASLGRWGSDRPLAGRELAANLADERLEALAALGTSHLVIIPERGRHHELVADEQSQAFDHYADVAASGCQPIGRASCRGGGVKYV